MKRKLFYRPFCRFPSLSPCAPAALLLGKVRHQKKRRAPFHRHKRIPRCNRQRNFDWQQFSIEAGTVLSGWLYLFCRGVKVPMASVPMSLQMMGTAGQRKNCPGPTRLLWGIKLRPDGFMLGMQGQQVVYAARGGTFKTADISALGSIDGISAVYPIDSDTFTVTGGRTETFVNEDGQEQETIHPFPSRIWCCSMMARW